MVDHPALDFNRSAGRMQGDRDMTCKSTRERDIESLDSVLLFLARITCCGNDVVHNQKEPTRQTRVIISYASRGLALASLDFVNTWSPVLANIAL